MTGSSPPRCSPDTPPGRAPRTLARRGTPPSERRSGLAFRSPSLAVEPGRTSGRRKELAHVLTPGGPTTRERRGLEGSRDRGPLLDQRRGLLPEPRRPVHLAEPCGGA